MLVSPLLVHHLMRPRVAEYADLPNGEALYYERQAAWRAEGRRLARTELWVHVAGAIGGVALTIALVLVLRQG